jgi:tRNA pseudouridine55 synthase
MRSPIDGLLLVDKPAGKTSHDIIAHLRRVLAERRVGHVGTLDPFATGLLVVLVGKATRLAPYVPGEPKVYDASIRFGEETDTDDRTGRVIRSAGVPTRASVEHAMAALTGVLSQMPPAYSAKQVGGVRAHRASRAGVPLTLAPARVVVHEWVVARWDAERIDVTVVCGAGTYVRALARDLGRLTGSAAHLVALRRLRSGPFDVADACRLEDALISQRVRPPLDAVVSLPRIELEAADRTAIVHGRQIPARHPGTTAAMVDGAGDLVAIAARQDDVWSPRVVLGDA